MCASVLLVNWGHQLQGLSLWPFPVRIIFICIWKFKCLSEGHSQLFHKCLWHHHYVWFVYTIKSSCTQHYLYQRNASVLALCEQKTASGASPPLTSLAQTPARTFGPQHVRKNHSAAQFPWIKHRNIPHHWLQNKPELNKKGLTLLCPSQSSLMITTFQTVCQIKWKRVNLASKKDILSSIATKSFC